MAVVVADLVCEEQVILDLRATCCDDALREVVSTISGPAKVREPARFLEEVIARERKNSTYVGNGVAFPHARTDVVSEIVLGIGRSVHGVDFGGEGERAHLLFLIGVPQRMVTDYLVCVGALARLTRDEKTRGRLMEVATAAEFVAILREGSLLLE
ncbi:MAG TPA: PTS sugar transporter subunit IIA [Chthoniobacterales bacterium]